MKQVLNLHSDSIFGNILSTKLSKYLCNQIFESLFSRMELLRVTKTFSPSQYPCFDKSEKTSCMYEPSEQQNNLDLLLIDLGLVWSLKMDEFYAIWLQKMTNKLKKNLCMSSLSFIRVQIMYSWNYSNFVTITVFPRILF